MNAEPELLEVASFCGQLVLQLQVLFAEQANFHVRSTLILMWADLSLLMLTRLCMQQCSLTPSSPSPRPQMWLLHRPALHCLLPIRHPCITCIACSTRQRPALSALPASPALPEASPSSTLPRNYLQKDFNRISIPCPKGAMNPAPATWKMPESPASAAALHCLHPSPHLFLASATS